MCNLEIRTSEFIRYFVAARRNKDVWDTVECDVSYWYEDSDGTLPICCSVPPHSRRTIRRGLLKRLYRKQHLYD
jgi:hypothetical protein